MEASIVDHVVIAGKWRGLSRASAFALPRDEIREGAQSLCAHMVLDAFRVSPGGVAIDPERSQESLDQLVSRAAALGEIAAELGEEDAAIRPLRNKALLDETLEHFGDGRLRDTEPRRDIDLARFPAIADQIGDELDIVLDELDAPCFPGLAEAFDLRARVDERRKLADGASRGLDRHAFPGGFRVPCRREVP